MKRGLLAAAKELRDEAEIYNYSDYSGVTETLVSNVKYDLLIEMAQRFERRANDCG